MGEPKYDAETNPSQAEMLLDFLDAARADAKDAVAAFTPEMRNSSALPSRWTPLEVLVHLAFMERRWLVAGFLGEEIARPFADRGDVKKGRFVAPEGWDLDEAVAVMDAQAIRTREIVSAHGLGDRAAVGDWFATADEAPALGWILLHVLGEYKQHQGHLDIVTELVKAHNAVQSEFNG